MSGDENALAVQETEARWRHDEQESGRKNREEGLGEDKGEVKARTTVLDHGPESVVGTWQTLGL
jgi:hypothetical protein